VKYRTTPADLEGMPPGVPYIISNEAAERFSFYGMKTVLAVFMASYLHLMDSHPGAAMSEAAAAERVHLFNFGVYLTPLIGALLADCFLGKYLTILLLSLVYCIGHATLAGMGMFGDSPTWLFVGLGLICLGSGGIKPCVSAHVGDQFGVRNAHLLPRIFNWFYFSINTGAAVSSLATPWLLEWYGPHWAFGVPGVLMALATILFWMGRNTFIHVPAGGLRFFNECFSPTGLAVLLKLLPLYLFVAVFWALFDQGGSTWVFQSQDMDLHFLGFDWLPSQIQFLNSFFVLAFIPLFAYVIYPLVDRGWKLTPLRKIGLGLFIMVTSFAIVAYAQGKIDGGERPSVAWQVLAYALLTASEIMISIVSLEFAYTQAPKTMKSVIMCYYLGAVAIGNLSVALVNQYIQIPSAASRQFESQLQVLPKDWHRSVRQMLLAGYDGMTGTKDDYLQRVSEGQPTELTIPTQERYQAAVEDVKKRYLVEKKLPRDFQPKQKDLWGNPIQYEVLNASCFRLISAGPDKREHTEWDQGLMVKISEPEGKVAASFWDRFHPAQPWLKRRMQELGMKEKKSTSSGAGQISFDSTAFVGGQTRLHGEAYFWFFTWLMLGTAIAFVPYALLYREKTYLQD
jgi:proton-dependent oligopeptide transporter, POT family